MDHLICNFKDCYKELSEVAVITTCSHIFCVDHGKFKYFHLKQTFFDNPIKIGNKLKLLGKCFACNHELSDHQVLETNLNLSVNSKKVSCVLLAKNILSLPIFTIHSSSFLDSIPILFYPLQNAQSVSGTTKRSTRT